MISKVFSLPFLSALLLSCLSSSGMAFSVSKLSSCRAAAQLSQLSAENSSDRRSFLASAAVVYPAALMTWSINADTAFAADTKSLIADLESTRSKLDPIPGLIKAENWDQVRTILKTPPVNFLWNMGDSKNPVQLLALETDDLDLIEFKDDIAISLQMCDQLVYDNVFLPFQPGNGKIKIKEPTDLAVQAMKQMDDVLKRAKEAAN